jgi:kumamolisin
LRTSFYCLLLLLLVVPAYSQRAPWADLAAHPHFKADRSFQPATGFPAPYETPASLACNYQLVTAIVPGCPVATTTALPSGGSGTIAIVNAFDYPAAQKDLNTFSQRFGIPLCSTSNPCLSVVFAAGTRPVVDPLWASNAANVIEYLHAFAPTAKIVLVEAATSSLTDLMVAIQKANDIISTSASGKGEVILPFGLPEFVSETIADEAFTTPGVVYIAGNEGAPDFLEYPAVSPNVIAVAATGLLRDAQGNSQGEISTTFFAGGNSKFESRPSYQDGIQSLVKNHRGVPDVAFACDPIISPEIFYDSIPLDGFVGWQFTGNLVFGEAFWAAVINQAGSFADSTAAELTILYGNLGNSSVFTDITHGSAIGVKAKPGWDFVTGLGADVGFTGK